MPHFVGLLMRLDAVKFARQEKHAAILAFLAIKCAVNGLAVLAMLELGQLCRGEVPFQPGQIPERIILFFLFFPLTCWPVTLVLHGTTKTNE